MALGVARRGWLDFPALSGSSWCGRCGSGPDTREWKRQIAKYAIMGASNVMRLGEGGEGRR